MNTTSTCAMAAKGGEAQELGGLLAIRTSKQSVKPTTAMRKGNGVTSGTIHDETWLISALKRAGSMGCSISLRLATLPAIAIFRITMPDMRSVENDRKTAQYSNFRHRGWVSKRQIANTPVASSA